jgi:hypothetical protein
MKHNYIAKAIIGAVGLLTCAAIAFSPLPAENKQNCINIVAIATVVVVLFV